MGRGSPQITFLNPTKIIIWITTTIMMMIIYLWLWSWSTHKPVDEIYMGMYMQMCIPVYICVYTHCVFTCVNILCVSMCIIEWAQCVLRMLGTFLRRWEKPQVRMLQAPSPLLFLHCPIACLLLHQLPWHAMHCNAIKIVQCNAIVEALASSNAHACNACQCNGNSLRCNAIVDVRPLMSDLGLVSSKSVQRHSPALGCLHFKSGCSNGNWCPDTVIQCNPMRNTWEKYCYNCNICSDASLMGWADVWPWHTPPSPPPLCSPGHLHGGGGDTLYSNVYNCV